jgi:hypothetical protein
VLDESVLTGEAQSVQREVGTAFGALSDRPRHATVRGSQRQETFGS